MNDNSLRNKFSSIVELVKDNIDVLLISETKVDSIFPSEQFAIDNYKLFAETETVSAEASCFT